MTLLPGGVACLGFFHRRSGRPRNPARWIGKPDAVVQRACVAIVTAMRAPARRRDDGLVVVG